MKDDQVIESDSINVVMINISIPEKHIERNIEWNLNDTIDSLKSFVLKLLPDLDDPLNYGFFLPACNGKIGKFLQEERILNHYLLQSPYKLELQKKIRINFSASSKLRKINTKSSQKQFIQFIKHSEIMKINKFLSDGLDPNFHVIGVAETPLTLACRLQDPHKIIMALVSNGAYLDFRATDSMTALHKVAKEGLLQPMKTLLQLGQSPNCKDSKGYTPLYYCIENDAPPECVNLLLYEHSIMGIRDEQGFQEIHKACIYGRTNHLDHLLTYGADIDAKTNKGSNALHICALHNQGSCARLLLYRGITRHALDFENKSAYQTALLSNNLDIADLIQNFKDEDVVPVTTLPKFNDKRRSIFPLSKRFSSSGKLDDQIDDVRYFDSKSQNINPRGDDNINSSDIDKAATYISQSTNKQSLQYLTNSSMKSTPTSSLNMKSDVKARIPIALVMSHKFENIPRTVILQKGSRGFGFVIKGLKNESEIISKAHGSASQYFECIAENSPAFHAGLLIGDYLLEVNGIDVHEMSHESVVKIIQTSGDCLTLKVITINPITVSSEIFDTTFETKSNYDSQSIISENGSFMNSLNSEHIVESIVDTANSVSINNYKSKPETSFQNMTPFIAEKQKKCYNTTNYKTDTTFDSSDSIILQTSKFQAPPPPIRNDKTSLTMSNNNINCEANNLNMLNKNLCQIPKNTFNNSKLSIPPPDYSSNTNNSNFLKLESQEFICVSELPNTCNNAFTLPPPPPPPPLPPLTSIFLPQNNTASISSINRTSLNLSKELSNISLKRVSQSIDINSNSDFSPILNDHSEALKNAVLNHRKKIECGNSQSNNIDEKLKENKIGNKSLIFEANSVLPLSNESIESDSITKSFNLIDNKHTIMNASRNPVVLPKPNTQNFSPKNVHSNNESFKSDNQQNNEINLRLKAENLRSNLLKKEQENKKGTLYFTNEK